MDIDTDFRPDIKDLLLTYLKKRYGEKAVAQILTVSRLQGKSAIKFAARMLASRDTIELQKQIDLGNTVDKNLFTVKSLAKDTDNESYVKELEELGIAVERREAKKIEYLNIADKLIKKDGVSFDGGESILDNREALLAGDDVSQIEKEIVEAAIVLDNNVDHTGLHAAGVIISDNDDLTDYIPIAWDNGMGTWKTQCEKGHCEETHGLLKMDLLLLKTLSIITWTIRNIKERTGKVDFDIENLPDDAKVFKQIYADGNVTGVFQFESSGMRSYLKKLQPTSIADIIAMNALYRPGPMDSIPDYIEAKNSGNIKYDCPELEPILKETYGQIVFQEQVMQIVRDLAGYSMGRSDLVRRAMAKKHMDELVAERKNFVYGNEAENIHGCVNIGISEDVANRIFDKMISFAAYAFNKAHAAAYSVTSYMTAWLKLYYPTDFLCACLNFAEKQEEMIPLFSDCQLNGITLLPPDVNKSEKMFTVEGEGKIRYGLGFLKGAKNAVNPLFVNRAEHLFTSYQDVVVNSGLQKSVLTVLVDSGAMDCFLTNVEGRHELAIVCEKLFDLNKKIERQKEKLESAKAEYVDDQSDKIAKKVNTAENDLNALMAQWDMIKVTYGDSVALEERLINEFAATANFFTGNPLDEYEIPRNVTNIDDLETGRKCNILGVVYAKEVKKTKKDAKEYLMGSMSDKTGSIQIYIFPSTYEKLKDNWKMVNGFTGKLVVRDDERMFYVSDTFAINKKENVIIINETPTMSYNDIQKFCRQYDDPSGYAVQIRTKNNKLYSLKARISKESAANHNLSYMIMGE